MSLVRAFQVDLVATKEAKIESTDYADYKNCEEVKSSRLCFRSSYNLCNKPPSSCFSR